jgi:hypothetical protein
MGMFAASSHNGRLVRRVRANCRCLLTREAKRSNLCGSRGDSGRAARDLRDLHFYQVIRAEISRLL